MQRAEVLKFSGRYELLKPIIKESFALPFMARKSVGRYWKKLKHDEKLHYVEVYTDWSVATYASRFDDYSGETFYVHSKTETDRKTVTVISRLTKADGEKIDFHYKLRRIDEKWLIVDIQISGVSQLALTRSQFLEVIKSKDFAALISKLQNKINLFSKEKNFSQQPPSERAACILTTECKGEITKYFDR